MLNTYTLIAVDPAAPFTDADGNPVTDVAINTAGAEALIDWLLSEDGKPAYGRLWGGGVRRRAVLSAG